MKRLWNAFSTIGLRMAMGVIFFAAVLSTLMLLFSSHRFNDDDMAHWEQESYLLARTVAVLCNQQEADRAYKYVRDIYDAIPEEERTDPEDPGYQANYRGLATDGYEYLRSRIQRVAQENGVEWICFVIVDEENGRMVYVLDTEEREDLMYAPGYWTEMADSDAEMFELSEERIVEADISYSHTIKDGIFRCVAPYYSYETEECIGYVMIMERMDVVIEAREAFLRNLGIALGIVTLIMAVITFLVIRRLIIRPVKQLTHAAEAYSQSRGSKQRQNYFSNLKIRTGDELERLSDSMKEMEQALNEYMDNLQSVTAEQERTRTEIGVAGRIQQRMLPKQLSDEERKGRFYLSHYIRPARQIGGDFYDFFMIDEDHVAVIIADVSGKGVSAAFFMVIAITLIRNTLRGEESLSEMVAEVNEQLCANNPDSMFVTAWIGIYTISGRHFTCVNAGHDDPLIIGASGAHAAYHVEDHDLPLGVVDDWEYKEQGFELAPGDRILLYTDGITEATRADDAMYGSERLSKAAARLSDKEGDDFVNALCADVDGFVGEAPQFDDMTLLLFTTCSAAGIVQDGDDHE